jgi:L-asparaginase
MNKKEKMTVFALTIGMLVSLIIYLTLYSKNKFKEFYTNQKICVINTGVEIEKNFKKQYFDNKFNIGDFDMLKFDDASSSPDDWNNLAKKISDNYDKYDAFLILVRKDAITYTASALSFMLENIDKPVIISNKNLLESLLVTAKCNYPEVMILSHKFDQNKKKIPILLRGCRTIQYSSNNFLSPNYPPLTSTNCLKKPKEDFNIKLFDPKIKITIVKLFPGFPVDTILKISAKDVDGVIIEKYNETCLENLSKQIEELEKKGVIIVSVNQKQNRDKSQFLYGTIDGKDITVEAAFAKLYYILSNVEDLNLVPKIFNTNYRGEISDF